MISEEKKDERRIFLASFNKYGLTKNISQGGLCLLLNEQLGKGTILRVDFDLSGEGKAINHIEAVVKMMWQEQVRG